MKFQNQGPKTGRSRAPERRPKMEPKTRTKIGPKSGPKMESGAPNLYGGANKVYMIFIQRSAGRSDSIVQQTNNFNQRRKGNLGWQNCSKSEHEYIHRPHIVKTCFTCKRYTVKSHAWENQQHACYCIFWQICWPKTSILVDVAQLDVISNGLLVSPTIMMSVGEHSNDTLISLFVSPFLWLMTGSLRVLGLPEFCENLCPSGLLCVISGLLAGGSPGFRTVLCCFLSQISCMAMFFVWSFCCFGSHHTNPLDDAQAIIFATVLNRPSFHLADGCAVWLVFVFVCVLVLLLFRFRLLFWFVFVLHRHRDGLPGLCTGPLSVRPLVAHLLTKMDEFQCIN